MPKQGGGPPTPFRVKREPGSSNMGKFMYLFATNCCSLVVLLAIPLTTMATILGRIPIALALQPRSEQYAPLARAILRGLVSGMVTVVFVPTAYLLIHRNEEHRTVEMEVYS